MSNNTLIYGKDPTNNNHVIQCSTDGNMFVEVGPESSIAIVDPSNDNILKVNNDGSINVVGGSGSGGIVQGYDIISGLGVDINASVNLLEGVNRLYTHSNLYVNQEGQLTPTELPLNCDDDGYLNVNVKVGGGGGGGVIQGVSTQAPNPTVNFSAEVIPIIGGGSINKLFTHSSIYGKNAITEQDKQVDVDSDGYVSVNIKNTPNVVEAKTNDGNNQPISSTDYSGNRALNVSVANTTAIPVSGTFFQGTQPVSISSAISSNTRDGSSNLITSTVNGAKRGLDCNISNTSIAITSSTLATQATLSALNNKVYNDITYPGAIQTTVRNNIINVPITKSLNYDVVLNADLYADSQPIFIADPRGHQGWYYETADNTQSSNVYFYANIPASGDTVQSNILLTQLNYFYAVITLDYIGTDPSNLPILVLGSQVTGVNDHIPNFSNTVYTFSIQTASYDLVLGEPIFIYYAENVINVPPLTLYPNLRRFQLTPSSTAGPGAGTNIAYLSINTQTQFTQKVNYTLISAGFRFSGVGGSSGDVGDILDFSAEFTANNTIQNKLLQLTFNGNNELVVSSGTNNIIQGKDTTTGNPVDIDAIDNKLLVINSSLPQLGSFGNIANNTTLTTGADTSIFTLTGGNYNKDCVLTINDSSITATEYYSISVSSNAGTNYESLGIVQPIVLLNGSRGGSTTLNLTPYNRIKLTNESAGSFNNVYISLYSS